MNIVALYSLYVAYLFSTIHCEDIDLILKATSPTTLDTPIFLTAVIFPYTKGQYEYVWRDDTGKEYRETAGPVSNWTLIYNSDHDDSYIGKRTVYATVVRKDLIVTGNGIYKWIHFELSEYLNGKLSYVQPNVTNPSHYTISTTNATNITTNIHDPMNWIRDRTEMISFYWQINHRATKNVTMIGPCLTPSLIINITEPGEYLIQSNIVLWLSDDPITTTTTSTTTTTTTTTTTPVPDLNKTTTSTMMTTTETFRNITTITPPPDIPDYKCDGYWNGKQPMHIPSQEVDVVKAKYGFLVLELEAKDPVSHLNITGSTWLKHGQMMRLRITCNGTGHFEYCYRIDKGSYNDSNAPSCDVDKQFVPKCDFHIDRYFRNGTYTVTVKITNEVSVVNRRMTVIVYNVDHKPQLSHIIVPVACSLIAIIIIIFGVAHYMASKQRYNIEVADFDFSASENGDDYRTFFEQLRVSCISAFSADIDSNEDSWHPRSRVEHPRILEEDD